MDPSSACPPSLATPLPPAEHCADPVDLALLERWLCGWSLARGLPLPRHEGGGLVVDVGEPDQLRRHVFDSAGAALQTCAAAIDAPLVFIKATVDDATLRAALPPRWRIDSPRFLMRCDGALATPPAPQGYVLRQHRQHGATRIDIVDQHGAVGACGQLVVHGATAVFDQIETAAAHRRRGLGRTLMGALDQLARAAGVRERLLVATAEGRALYLQLGWYELAPYATAVLAPPPPGRLANGQLHWRHGQAMLGQFTLRSARRGPCNWLYIQTP